MPSATIFDPDDSLLEILHSDKSPSAQNPLPKKACLVPRQKEDVQKLSLSPESCYRRRLVDIYLWIFADTGIFLSMSKVFPNCFFYIIDLEFSKKLFN